MLPKPPKRGPKAKRRIARKRAPRPRRQTQRAALMRQADRLWSRLVKERDGRRCRCCGGRYGIEAAHVFPKGAYPAVRFDPENGLALDAPCHRAFPSTSLEWFKFARNELGGNAYERLRWRAVSGRLDTAKALEVLRGVGRDTGRAHGGPEGVQVVRDATAGREGFAAGDGVRGLPGGRGAGAVHGAERKRASGRNPRADSGDVPGNAGK